MRRAGVVGLGLIGGSIARELAARGGRVLARDANEATLAAALREGVVAEPLGDAAAGEGLDVLVLAVPVDAAPGELARAAAWAERSRLVTDAGSTKQGIVAAAESLGLRTFVGAHPLAGDHRSGWASSRRGLFEGAPVYLCPSAGQDAAVLERAVEFWRLLGARPEVMTAAEHDRLLAWTSHLPQVAATALARALQAHAIPRARLGPGGRDATRLAASSPAVWTGIALENAAALEDATRALEERLHELRRALAERDAGALHRLFEEGHAWATAE
ncbi:MAG: prephenate dehydrogenase [Gemmatimonadetes bacterium]|nr:prephenate dehydrogenase [Gemmatimonadota bacterium]